MIIGAAVTLVAIVTYLFFRVSGPKMVVKSVTAILPAFKHHRDHRESATTIRRRKRKFHRQLVVENRAYA